VELYHHRPRQHRLGDLGLGTFTTGEQTAASLANAGAQTTASILMALGSSASNQGQGGTGGTTGGGISNESLVGIAISAIAAIGMGIAALFSGCGQTCTQATSIANQVGDYLAQNLAAYLASPVHYASLQAAALNNFNTAWAALVQGCSSAQLSNAGQDCISQRQQGACAYKTSPGGWSMGSSAPACSSGTASGVACSNAGYTYTYPGANGSGSSCWNYFVGFHDPIASDPTVVPDPSPLSSVSPSSSASSSTSLPATFQSGATPGVATTTSGLPMLLILGAFVALFVTEEM
jgi:hypothetical protein